MNYDVSTPGSTTVGTGQDLSFDLSFLKQSIKERPNKALLDRFIARALATYYGDESIIGYIEPFSRSEEAEKLAWRREKTICHYRNYVRGVIRQYIEGVFGKGEVTRKCDIPEVDQWVDKKYDRWAKSEVYPFALLLPELYIKITRRIKPAVVPTDPKQAITPVDDPTAEVELDPEEATLKDEQDVYGVPVPVTVYPGFVRNFELDEDGELRWICIECDWSKKGNAKLFELYDATTLTIIDEKGNIVQPRAPHGFPSIPIKRVRWEENNRFNMKPPTGHSMMYSIVQLTLGALQVASCLVEAIYLHLNLKLAVDQDTYNQLVNTGMGNSEALVMSGGPDSKPPFYVQLPSTEIDKLIDIVFNKVAEVIYDEARLIDRSSTKVQSGYAKLLDLVPENMVKQEISVFFYDIDEWVISMIASGYRAKKVDVKIAYPVSFDNNTVSDTVDQVKSLSEIVQRGNMPFSPSAMVSIMRQVYVQMNPDAQEDEVTAWIQELKEWLDNYKADQKLLQEEKAKTAAANANGQAGTTASGISALPELPASQELSQMAEDKAGKPPIPSRMQAVA